MINATLVSPNSSDGIAIELAGVAADGVTPIYETINLIAGIDYRSTSSTGATTCDVANLTGGATGGSCSGETSPTAKSQGTDYTPDSSTTNSIPTLNDASLGAQVIVDNSVAGSTSGTTNYWMDVQDIDLGAQAHSLTAFLTRSRLLVGRLPGQRKDYSDGDYCRR